MTRDPALTEQLRLMMEKAGQTLAVAQTLHDHGHYDDATSRAYYAVFQALQAVLLTEGLSVSKHSGLLAVFNQRFIRTGRFPATAFRTVKRLFRDRQTGDYEYGVTIGEDESATNLRDAGELIADIRRYLSCGGYISERQH